MKVTREEARRGLVRALRPVLDTLPKGRVKYPGMPEVDVSEDKSLHVNVDMVYMDGWAVELGPNSNQRRIGTIVLEVVVKEGSPKDMVEANDLLDKLEAIVSNTDLMRPIRTFGTKQVTPTSGAIQGMVREALVTPFWYDTSK